KEKNDGLGLEYATRWSYGKSETMTFLIPNFMGGSTGKSVLEDNESETLKYLRTIRNQKKVQKLQQQTSSYWGSQPGTSPTYVGAIIFFLFVLGILYDRSPLRIWILLATILSIMLAWGHNFMGLTEFFFNYVPYYNKFRAVTMAMIIAEFGIALLAILALNKFLNNIGVTKEDNKGKEKKLKLAFYIIGGITFIFALFPSIFVNFLSNNDLLNDNIDFTSRLASDRESILKSDAWRSFIFIFLSAGTLWMFIKGKIKKQYVVIILGILILTDLWSVDKRYLNETHFVKETESSFIPTKADKKILKNNKNQSRVFNYNNPFNESRTSYFHNSIGGYHAAKLLRYQELIDNQLSKNNISVLSMLNCGWIITQQGQSIPSTNQGVNPLGNAWFVSEVNMVDSANQEMESLNTFNPATTLIVDKRFSENVTEFRFDSSATIKLIQQEYKPNHLTYNLKNITSDQIAVFSEIYYEKGWNAYIDGKIVPHFRANYVLRAMMVPAGTTKIEFKFEPTSYSIGESVAYASSIILLLLLGFVSYRELK
ncbi:MAG: YfhO family protein, partial [Flavobacteriales bacterium]|nr:YfhO family protein [Flavobacteriales bacterium]